MERLDHYWKVVKRYLPRTRKNELFKELPQEIRSQLEGREAERGAILTQHGYPTLVAFGRELIGPVLFPLYVTVLWINLGIAALVLAIYALATGEPIRLPWVLVNVLLHCGIVTLVFVLLNSSQLGRSRLIDRYLQAVRRYLPRGQRDDIVKELSANLLSQMEDKEAELGRPLTEAEQQAVLEQQGHPMIVAGRYRGDHRSLVFGRQLIGPALFPFYARALWWTLGIAAGVCAAAAIALAGGLLSRIGVPATSIPEILPSVLLHVFLNVFVAFGVVTLAFVLMEVYHRKSLQNWFLLDRYLQGLNRYLPGEKSGG
jgi:hypothetical protein